MEADSSTEHSQAPSAGTGSAAAFPPADINAAGGEAAGSAMSGHNILKGARLQQKAEQLAIGSAGLTSNAVRGAGDKLASAVIPAIAKAVLRALIPRK